MRINRRQFGAGSLASLAFAGLARSAQTQGAAQGPDTYRNEVPGYGPLALDPAGLFDLPPGFRYSVISSAGEAMDDGYVTPGNFDGMGCFPLDATRVALVRNHELGPARADRGPAGGLARLEARLAKEPHFGTDKEGRVLPGGTSTIVYDIRSGRRTSQYLSLAGTAVNCAGGATPWGSWLTCEETVLKAPETGRSHGWVFDVPTRQRGLARPVPLTAMGRFKHEAAAVDPRSGIVYLTEDQGDSLFYRFLPHSLTELAQGGRLQALGLRDAPRGSDTRNWKGVEFEPGSTREAVWIDMDGVESPGDDLRLRGHAAGGAIFARGEGIQYDDGQFFFTCTSGGAAKLGQIMRYVPSPAEGRPGERDRPGRLQLFFESRDEKVMDYGDNLTVAPSGHLIVCEDRQGGEINHLKGVTPEGRVYALARLNADTELAGVCFSADGSTMFVNVYHPGKTLAVTGPWRQFRS